MNELDEMSLGFLPTTLVMSASGMLSVSEMAIGDRVITPSGVRKVSSVERQLEIFKVFAFVISSPSPYCLEVASPQLILINDWRVGYLFGFDCAYISAQSWVECGTHYLRKKAGFTIKLGVSGGSAILAQGGIWLATHRLENDVECGIPLLSREDSRVLHSYCLNQGVAENG